MDNPLVANTDKSVFAWDNEQTLAVAAAEGAPELDGHKIYVPQSIIDRDFFRAFETEEKALTVLRDSEIERIKSLVVPIENISIVPFLGVRRSLQVAEHVGDFTLFSLTQRCKRYDSPEVVSSAMDTIRQFVGWQLKYISIYPFNKSTQRSLQFRERYEKIWRQLNQSAITEKIYSNDNIISFDPAWIEGLGQDDRIKLLDEWLGQATFRTRAVLRLRNGITPNYGHKTQQEVGYFLTLSQSAVSHIERTNFHRRVNSFAQFLLYKAIRRYRN